MSEVIETDKLLLDAVNILLQTINELPIESEEDYDVVMEARMAKNTLIETKRDVLSERWKFNVDTNYLLPLDSENHIPVPANILDLQDAIGDDLVVRNGLLYSKKNQSHYFEEEQRVNITWDVDFNTLPHAIRKYVTIRAARIFVARTIGDQAAVTYTAVEEQNALVAARRSEGYVGKYNMFKSGYGVNNRVRIG